MEGMTDWNKLTMEQYIEHLEEKFKFDSSGTAKAVFELIAGYRALTMTRCYKSDKIMKKEWKRHELIYSLKEPKRWWHYLGVKQKEYDYTISFYTKSDDGIMVAGGVGEYS